MRNSEPDSKHFVESLDFLSVPCQNPQNHPKTVQSTLTERKTFHSTNSRITIKPIFLPEIYYNYTVQNAARPPCPAGLVLVCVARMLKLMVPA